MSRFKRCGMEYCDRVLTHKNTRILRMLDKGGSGFGEVPRDGRELIEKKGYTGLEAYSRVNRTHTKKICVDCMKLLTNGIDKKYLDMRQSELDDLAASVFDPNSKVSVRK